MWLSAAFGNAVLEIIPLRLCIGFPSRPLRRKGLDRQRVTRLGKLRANRDCLVWMRFRPRFSQQRDPAGANAMSGPRALTIVFMVACQTLQCWGEGINGRGK